MMTFRRLLVTKIKQPKADLLKNKVKPVKPSWPSFSK
jgi:hypothetical protein